MNILITGHLGYVGPNLIKQLRKNYPSNKLIGFDIGYFSNCVTYPFRMSETMLDEQYFGDVRNFPSHLLKGIDAVIHLAAISNDPMSNQYEDITYAINHKASIDIAKKAKDAGVKNFVFASSCSVYGFAADGERIESSDLNPLTAYAKSKVRTEEDLYPLTDNNFKVTCLRFSTACGMSDRLRLDLVLNDFVASAIADKKITILSDGTPWRPLINTIDMGRAMSWAISRDVSKGGNYLLVNVGSNVWNYQVKEIAEYVKEQFPEIEIVINPNAQPDKRSYRVNFDLFHSLAPGFTPQITIQQTISDLFNGLNAIGFNDKNFRQSNLIRLNMLNSLKANNFIDSNINWV